MYLFSYNTKGVAYEHDSPVDCFDHASSAGSSSYNPNKVDHFMSMGFEEKMVVQAIKENGEDNDEAILNSLLTYSVSFFFFGKKESLLLLNQPELKERKWRTSTT